MTVAATRRRWPKTLAIPAIGAALVWLVLRQAAIALLVPAQPAAAARFAPSASAALSAMAWERVMAAGGAVDATARDLATQALRRDPAAATPLVLLGFAASATGDLATARALIERARDRDPRDAVARFWLFDHAMRSGDYAAGLEELGPALRLRGAAAPQVMDVALTLLQIPAARAALRAKLARDPDWRATFFARAAATPGDLGALATLLAALPPPRDPAAAAVEQRLVLTNMVDRRQYAAAYATWRALLPPAMRARASGAVYDPRFAGLPGAAPFNWTLSSGDAGTATREPGRGLALFAANAGPQVLAEQWLLLAPGTYRLAVLAARGDDGIGTQYFEARLVCASDSSVRLALPLSPAGATPQMFAADAAVTPDCAALRLQFVTGQGGAASGARVLIPAVRLIRS